MPQPRPKGASASAGSGAIDMERKGRIALVGLAGLLIAGGLLVFTHRSQPVMDGITPVDEVTAKPDPVLQRCRTITMPESSCDAAWEAQRRHFFGNGGSK